jgi:hypothetical protein
MASIESTGRPSGRPVRVAACLCQALSTQPPPELAEDDITLRNDSYRLEGEPFSDSSVWIDTRATHGAPVCALPLAALLR